MNLAEFKEKIKSESVFLAAAIVLVGISGFGLGRLSKIDEIRPGITIEAPAAVGASLASEKAPENGSSDMEASLNSGEVVASKTGSKYHFPWCSGAKTIAEANKIWFNSSAEAKDAGYSPAANCRGLK